jgi:chromosome segregation ATPase
MSMSTAPPACWRLDVDATYRRLRAELADVKECNTKLEDRNKQLEADKERAAAQWKEERADMAVLCATTESRERLSYAHEEVAEANERAARLQTELDEAAPLLGSVVQLKQELAKAHEQSETQQHLIATLQQAVDDSSNAIRDEQERCATLEEERDEIGFQYYQSNIAVVQLRGAVVAARAEVAQAAARSAQLAREALPLPSAKRVRREPKRYGTQ